MASEKAIEVARIAYELAAFKGKNDEASWSAAIDAAAAVDSDAQPLSKSEIMGLWRAHGGDQHGPNIETVTMPLSKFCGFISVVRSLKRQK